MKYKITIGVLVVLIVLLNLLARFNSFCDFYTNKIFRIWAGTYGRVTGLLPFSVGEILIAIGSLILLGALVSLVMLIFLRKKATYRRYVLMYMKSFLVIILIVGLIMTLNCSISYNCSKLHFNNHNGAYTDFSKEQLKAVREYIVEQCIIYSDLIQRDEDFSALYDENVYKDVKESLHLLSSDFERLSGFYPNPKKMMGSFFMYQAGMTGVYFPFSMEANYNAYISATNEPFTVAHELCHLKGYMYENEANFLAYLACVGSKNPLVAYSGYLGVLGYVDDAYFSIVSDEEYYEQSTLIPELVWSDYVSYTVKTIEELKIMEEDTIISTDAVEKANDNFTDAYMNYYDATPNYDEVTMLLLEYYDGVLY